MLTSQRKSLLMDLLRRDGQIVAKSVAQQLGLSEDTIRRDLREMAAEGLLQRVHGGALPINPVLPDFTARQSIDKSGKERIGAKAASLISAGHIVFLDGGTTTAEVAHRLAVSCTVITHSPTIATLLAERTEVDVILIGGSLYRHSMVAIGATALHEIRQIRADIYFMGVTGIHLSEGLTTGHYEEAAIKRTIAERSSETYVLATREKIDVVSPYRVLPFEASTALITAPDVPADVKATYRKAGATILEA